MGSHTAIVPDVFYYVYHCVGKIMYEGVSWGLFA